MIYKIPKGITLMELVVVIVILGVLGFGIFSAWPSQMISLNAQAQQLATNIRYTQLLSMGRNQRCRVDFTSATSYRILNQSGTPINLPGSTDTVITLSGVITISAPGNYLVFDKRGIPAWSTTSTDNGTVISGAGSDITLSSDGESKTVHVTSETGKTDVS